MIDILYIFGAMASILGAIYAWRQATNAKAYAEKAKKQFAGHLRTSELSRLKTKWDSVYEALAIFGPGAQPTALRGRNTAEAGRKVQDYLAEVRRSGLGTNVDIVTRLVGLDQLLDQFSRSRGADEMKTQGAILLNETQYLDAAVCTALSKEQEAVELS
ncbi:MAG: hypothetical protein PHR28_03515 [candidate division Zixibacteria bacterium]|nr:hypothetical protein [candidate division Zixibacteria bacterium]